MLSLNLLLILSTCTLLLVNGELYNIKLRTYHSCKLRKASPVLRLHGSRPIGCQVICLSSQALISIYYVHYTLTFHHSPFIMSKKIVSAQLSIWIYIMYTLVAYKNTTLYLLAINRSLCWEVICVNSCLMRCLPCS